MKAQATPRKKPKYGIDLNRYLGVEFPEDRITVSLANVMTCTWLTSAQRPRPPNHRSNSSRFAFRNSLVSCSRQ